MGFIIVPLFHPRSMAASIESIVNFVITAQIFTPILNIIHTRALFCAWAGLAWPGLASLSCAGARFDSPTSD